MKVLVWAAAELATEALDLFRVSAMDSADFNVGDGGRGARVSAADVPAADQANVDRHLLERSYSLLLLLVPDTKCRLCRPKVLAKDDALTLIDGQIAERDRYTGRPRNLFVCFRAPIPANALHKGATGNIVRIALFVFWH